MPPEPIAIVGTGCRFPGSASSPSNLWKLLSSPRNVASEPPTSRFNIDSFYHPNALHHGTTNTKESYFLSENIRSFDASFFNIAAGEADSIDPQQRLLLETVYESLEAAGLRLDTLDGSSTGVFCGVMGGDWEHLLGIDSKSIPSYSATGMARSNLANRVSYFFNWRGPSLAVDTACSSSMVALHLAVTALRQGECAIAVASGANLILSPNMYIASSNLHMLSPNGRVHMWDAQADGYARGEGVASLVLKRLSDAIADADPIECVIRAIGVNQDGRSMGLTMPSSAAQLQLIRSTYNLAGLDPVTRREHRCQYFEAHGTGTPAGDRQEAAAIYGAFFGTASKESPDDVLHVGSVKTVIGHTEGTAGLAGIIKASLCIQHGEIVPNLHFHSLNPEIAPFASRLKVPTTTMPWPELRPGVPRRVSVNSFGFGGTNSHAILESFEPNLRLQSNQILSPEKPLYNRALLPFAFSAASESSLGALLECYLRYLEENPDVDFLNLAWSLLQRRSVFRYRLTLWAPGIDTLQSRIRAELDLRRTNTPTTGLSRANACPKGVLGVFTGQGAQWPQMCLDLVLASPRAREWLQELQESLDALPVKFRPNFSLFDELSAPESSSRMHKAAISQPLCTALQIVLVNLLSTLGITFTTVVGHSSGEIAAAYAAGLLSASDAIRIAYLRGHVACHARANDKLGAMLAAGIPIDEANDICDGRALIGRLSVASCNSPSSVTLSGDADAIQEVEWRLKCEQKFARVLHVDTAYHSHHMQPCSSLYLRALEACDINPKSLTSTVWYSSVYGGEAMNPTVTHSLTAEYWNDNMVKPVLFSQALTTAVLEQSSPDVIVEVGPHPALKGPIMQTLAAARPGFSDIPYIGLARRGTSSLETFAEAIGSLWRHVGADVINPQRYVGLFNSSRKLQLVRNLPRYPFDRSQSYWFETRTSKCHLQRYNPPHPLLGTLSPESTEGEWRWRNYLRRDEIEWLDGHQIQSQTIFPATGYIAQAVEAARLMASGRCLQLIQIRQLSIHQAIPFNDDVSGVEILFCLQNVQSDGNATSTCFNCYASIGGALKTCASGELAITWGEPDPMLLPSRPTPAPGLAPIDVDEFYSDLGKLGYGYSSPFRGITSLARRMDSASGLVQNINQGNSFSESLLIHPALMDTSLQTLLGAMGDGQLFTLHIPTQIEAITINPAFSGKIGTPDVLSADANVTKLRPDGIVGDVELYTHEGHCIVQFEGVHVSPLVMPSAADDRLLFSELTWGPLRPDSRWGTLEPSAGWLEKLHVHDHIAFLYMKDVDAKLTTEDRHNLDWHRSRVVAWIDHVLSLTRELRHPVCRPEWLQGTIEDVQPLFDAYPGVGIDIMEAVGTNLLRFLRGETTMLEVLRENDLLGRFYRDEPETKLMNEHVGNLAGQIAFRFPRMKILEIGAGTASATRAVFNQIGRSYHSYTFTDISAGFFDNAREALAEHEDRLIYSVLDIERDPVRQGYEEHAYDLVIAANVLHATKHLKQTMTHVRQLLKPGGYLIALESTNTDAIRISFIVCGFEGWWAGEDDGRVWGPMLTTSQWETLLEATGFSGFETITPPDHAQLGSYSVFVSQAIDDRISLLRDPMISPSNTGIVRKPAEDLILLGGATKTTSNLMTALEGLLTPYFSRITRAESLEELDLQGLSMATALSMLDLDRPCFENITEDGFNALKAFINVSQKLLWVTASTEIENPYFSMSKGFIGCLMYENTHSVYQYLNFAGSAVVDAELVATTLMRLVRTDFDNDHSLSICTSNVEPELRFEGGMMKIPRIRNEPSMNLRYAANHRKVQQPIDLESATTRIDTSGDRLALIADNETQKNEDFGKEHCSKIRLRVRLSTLSALKVRGIGFLHLVIGRQTGTNARILALSTQHASEIETPSFWYQVIPDVITENEEAPYLRAVAFSLLARYLVHQAHPGTALLVHEADDVLRRAIWIQAVSKGLHPCFSSSKQLPNTLFFHERSPTRALVRLIPDNVSVVARFDDDDVSKGVMTRVESLLPETVSRETFRSLSRPSSARANHADPHAAREILDTVHAMAIQLTSDICKSADTIAIDQLFTQKMQPHSLKIVDWSQTREPIIEVQPASSQVKLSGRKTYLLIGMTGDLGQSVCHWMITKGARKLVLASRTPKIDKRWVSEMSTLGAQVVPMAMDVTDRNSVLRVDRMIRQKLPPLGGVVNGAMVLGDRLFADMSFEAMQSILDPKVKGSSLLDELYRGPDLDFFILFGSLAGVVGNWGQSAYTAGTNFMSSLIRRRRGQNLVGSIIHPGEVRGVGYIARIGAELSQRIANTLGSHIVSERELHELFAEAILAGRPQSGRNPEIIAGMSLADPAKQPNIIWYRNPKTWNYVDYSIRSTTPASPGGEVVPLRAQLESATSLKDATEVVVTGLSTKIQSKLHLSADVPVCPDVPLGELGVDSLVAVDLRTWIVKELEVDIPVLQILGGSSIGELANDAAAKLPASLLPKVPRVDTPKETGATVQKQNGFDHPKENSFNDQKENGALMA